MKAKREIDFDKALESVFSILMYLTDKEKEQIAMNCSCIFLPKRKMIFSEGEIPSHLICLVNGQAKLYKEGLAGRDWITRMVNSVELIGYQALFSGEKYNVSAQTIQDSVICKIEKDVMFSIFKKNHKVILHIMKILARELGFLRTKTITLTQKHIKGRLAETLLFLADTYGFDDDKQTIKVTLSREDLANLSNMTTANAIRTLSMFNAEGLVVLDGRTIKLVNVEGLKKISQLGFY
jgi:CRP-like cAMP-binding protein